LELEDFGKGYSYIKLLHTCWDWSRNVFME